MEIEAETLRLASAGDPAAWARVVRTREPGLLRLALAILRHEEDARDACQDVFRHAFQKLPEFEPSGRFDLWLRRILVNRCRDVLRRRRVRFAAADELERMPPEPVRPETLIDAREDQAKIRRALDGLSHDFREVLILHLLEDLPIGDVADALGITVNAARIRLRRGLIRLRGLVRGETP